MTHEQKIYASITKARQLAPSGHKTSELHLQLLKHALDLYHVDRKVICEELHIGQSYTAEIGKMRNIVDRLVAAGLDLNKI
ncbi:MAG: transcription factor [Leclercia adecarboxylata]|nr:transcription factor [Leclercia adecarboxylata]